MQFDFDKYEFKIVTFSSISCAFVLIYPQTFEISWRLIVPLGVFALSISIGCYNGISHHHHTHKPSGKPVRLPFPIVGVGAGVCTPATPTLQNAPNLSKNVR